MDIPDLGAAILISVVSGFVGGSFNYLLNKKKTDAEIDNLRAEAAKFLAEAQQIHQDAKHELKEVIYNDSDDSGETVIYDGRQDAHGYDITSDLWDYTFQDGVISIHESDAHYQLQTYRYDGNESTFIPKNETLSGFRKFHVSCDLKVISASYRVSVYMMEEPDLEGHSVDDRDITVSGAEWTSADYYLRALPDKNYLVKIGVERVSGKGSLQIRNLVVAERVD